MKVRELQEQLATLDPELDVMCYSEDANLLAEGRGFILLNVLAINKVGAERLRLDDGTPYLRVDASSSDAIAVLEVTADF